VLKRSLVQLLLCSRDAAVCVFVCVCMCVCVCVCVRACACVCVRVRSDAYTLDDLVFHWRQDAKAVEVNEEISLPEYHLKKVSSIVCSQTINSTGSFFYEHVYYA